MKQVHDFLAGAKYPGIVKKYKRDGFGIFYNVDGFGPALPLITSLIGKVEFIRVQGTWSDTHTFGDNEFKQSLANAKELQKLTGKGTTIYYSLFCEHKIGDKAKLLSYFERVHALCPGLELVNSPMKGGAFLQQDWIVNEIHINGIIPRPEGRYFVSWDGNNCTDSDVAEIKRQYADAEILFFWHRLYNLNYSGKKEEKLPRSKRKTKPTDKVVLMVEGLMETKLTTGISSDHIFKIDSDQHNKDNTAADTQAHKLVFISPVQGEKAYLVGPGGRILATSRKGVVYKAEPNKRLYRFDIMGIDLAKKSRIVTIKVQGKDGYEIGSVDVYHRDGTFRNFAD